MDSMKTRQITKDELKRLYSTMTVREVAEHLGIHTATLYKLLDQAGIERKNSERVKIELVD